jgi:hypothetical protein
MKRMRNHFPRISGAVSLALLALLSGCRFPYGFAGGGLPRELRTVAVLPFENKTTTPGLERELTEVLAGDMRRLGLRDAAESRAHVIVTGTISRYEIDIPVAFSADPTRVAGTRRKLQLTVDVAIRNASTGRVLYEKRGASADGGYAEGAEAEGRKEAIEKLVNDIIQGVQSQW